MEIEYHILDVRFWKCPVLDIEYHILDVRFRKCPVLDIEYWSSNQKFALDSGSWDGKGRNNAEGVLNWWRYLRGGGREVSMKYPFPTPTWGSSDNWFKFVKMSSCAHRAVNFWKLGPGNISFKCNISNFYREVGYAVAYHGNSECPKMMMMIVMNILMVRESVIVSDKSRGKRKLFPEVAPISLHTTRVFLEIH